jgi:hypothetical protein
MAGGTSKKSAKVAPKAAQMAAQKAAPRRVAANPAKPRKTAPKWNRGHRGPRGVGGDVAWFLGFHCLTKYVKVAFFRGTSLRPVPSGVSRQKKVRYLDNHEHDKLDETQFAAWVKQAGQLPGWVP